MPESTVDAMTLAHVLEKALTRLGELGQPGLAAFNELMAGKNHRHEFDAGVNLLASWIAAYTEANYRL